MKRTLLIFCLVVAVCFADKLVNDDQPPAYSDNELPLSPSNAYLAPVESEALDSDDTFSSASYNAPAELDKEFYTFSASEADFEDSTAVQRALGVIKQGLRVVFIKGPENQGFEDAALALAKQAAKQQTAIYVLNKQTDIGNLANKINAAGRNINKPEVHFVKFRTAEDAVNAQRAIQSQYDSVGGNSHSINGGFAPVLNFASQSAFRLPHAQIPKTAYLPTSVFRRRY